jgi:hypothetical protein
VATSEEIEGAMACEYRYQKVKRVGMDLFVVLKESFVLKCAGWCDAIHLLTERRHGEHINHGVAYYLELFGTINRGRHAAQ